MDIKKYQIDKEENKQFLAELREDLFRFGRAFPSPGGSAWWLGDDGTPWEDRERATYETARMAHVYAMASLLGFAEGDALTDAALKGLKGELHDGEHGGWYAGLTQGKGISPGKMCYAHAFVILASAAGMLTGREGAKELFEDALAVYDRYFWEEEEGLACDIWNTEFTVKDDYRGLNANMHSVEAFLAAADIGGREEYRIRAGRIIDRVLAWASANEWRIPEHYTKDWVPDLDCNKDHPDDPFKPFGATPGHGLEWARLITQWALSTYKGADDEENRGGQADAVPSSAGKYIDAAENLFLRAVQDAWNTDGAPGLVYTVDWEGKPVVHDRMHWVLAEGINTAAVLYRVTGKAIYAGYYQQFLQYLDAQVVDHVNGSWFHQMDRNNQPIGTVWPGKNDLYHAVQATLIPYHRPDLSIALAVKTEK